MFKIEEFISLVQNHDFVEAHEVLEADWKGQKKLGNKDIAKFLQALINGTTSIALYKKGRVEASQKVWNTFEKYKDLIDTISLENHQRYIYAIELLENKYAQKEELI